MKAPPIFKSSVGKDKILAVYDSLLARWPVPYETFNFPTHAGSTFVIGCGDPAAAPLILLHGSRSNSAMWISDIRRFCMRYRVYAVDLPGEPGRSEAIRADLKGPTYADWLQAVYQALHIHRATLVGISLGGWFALKFATTCPDQVEALVLLCPSGIGPQRMSFLMIAIPLMFLGQWGIDRMIQFINGRQSLPDEALQYSKLIASCFNPRIETIPIFSEDELIHLTMRTLLIVGEKDALLDSMKTARRLSTLHPEMTVISLPNDGHVLINQADRIMAFLSS